MLLILGCFNVNVTVILRKRKLFQKLATAIMEVMTLTTK